MENYFGIDTKIIKEALKRGIKIKKGTAYIDNPGFISLVFVAILNKFVLAYGTDMLNSGYVELETYGKDWVLK